MTEKEQPTRADVEAAAYRFLARRDHARGELAVKLARRDFPGDLITEVLDECERAGYLDDARFALEQGRILARKCWGPLRIRQKLRKRGVDEQYIDRALEEIGAELNYQERAQARLHSRFGRASTLDEAARQKAFRHLRYRGYSPHLIRRLLFDS